MHPIKSDKVSDQITGNILDQSLLEQINLEFEITEIYHLAAILSTRAELSPKSAHDVNVNGSINLLELALKQSKSQNQPVKFFFPSSIAVYGVKERIDSCFENEYLNPITVYGANKLYIEKLGLYYSSNYEQLSENKTFIDFRSLRFPGLISSTTKISAMAPKCDFLSCSKTITSSSRFKNSGRKKFFSSPLTSSDILV